MKHNDHKFFHLCKSGNVLRGLMIQIGPSQFEWACTSDRKMSAADIREHKKYWAAHVAFTMIPYSKKNPKLK